MIPGPRLFIDQGDILYAIMLGLIVVNIFMYIAGKVFIRFYAHITRIPYEVLACIVLTFCLAGSYSICPAARLCRDTFGNLSLHH